MKYLIYYLLIGFLLYPLQLNIWYKSCYKKQEWYNPHQMCWYFNYILSVIGWVIVVPLTLLTKDKDE